MIRSACICLFLIAVIVLGGIGAHAQVAPSPPPYPFGPVVPPLPGDNVAGFHNGAQVEFPVGGSANGTAYFNAADYGVSLLNTASVNTTDLNAMFAAASAQGAPVAMQLPPGKLNFTPFTLPSGLSDGASFSGTPGATELLFTSTSGDLITWPSPPNRAYLFGFNIRDDSQTSGYAVTIKNSGTTLTYVGYLYLSTYAGINYGLANGTSAGATTFDNIIGFTHGGPGITKSGPQTNTVVTNVNLDSSPITSTADGFSACSNSSNALDTLQMNNSFFENYRYGLSCIDDGTVGGGGTIASNLTISSTYFDHEYSDALHFDVSASNTKITRVFTSKNWYTSVNGYGEFLNAGSSGKISDVNQTGDKTWNDGLEGFFAEGNVNGFNLIGVSSTGNGLVSAAAGIHLASGVNKFSIAGGTSGTTTSDAGGANQIYGVQIDTGVSNGVIGNMNLNGNATAATNIASGLTNVVVGFNSPAGALTLPSSPAITDGGNVSGSASCWLCYGTTGNASPDVLDFGNSNSSGYTQLGAPGGAVNGITANILGIGSSGTLKVAFNAGGSIGLGGSLVQTGNTVTTGGSGGPTMALGVNGAPSGACVNGSIYTRNDSSASAGAEMYVCRNVSGTGTWEALSGG